MSITIDTYSWQHLAPQQELRCFIGLWPEPKAAQHLGQIAVQTQQRYGGRAMLAAHMHLTLAFMGASPVGRLQRLLPELQELNWPALSLTLNHTGVFERAGVLWLGPDSAQTHVLEQLQQRHEQLWQLLQVLGWTRTERHFVPHVSLLRHVQALHSAPAQIPVAVPIYCQHAYLIASVPSEQGSQYRVLSRFGAGAHSD